MANSIFKKLTGRKIHKGSKILLLTHNDMDGAMPEVIARFFFYDVTVIHENNNNMDRAIRKAAEERCNEFDFIIITDISCSEETATFIDSNPEIAKKFILLDHHKTALALNNYSFAVVSPVNPEDSLMNEFYQDKNTNGMASGTSLFLDFLNFKGFEGINKTIIQLTHIVQGYDTWDWVNVFAKNSDYSNMNKLFFAKGVQHWCDETLDKVIRDNHIVFSEDDIKRLEEEQDKINEYIERKKKCFVILNEKINKRRYSICYTWAEEHLADVFDVMHETYPDADILVVDTGSGYSFRTRKDGIDVSSIAAKLGGGGHMQASGCHYDKSHKISLFKKIVCDKPSFIERIVSIFQ